MDDFLNGVLGFLYNAKDVTGEMWLATFIFVTSYPGVVLSLIALSATAIFAVVYVLRNLKTKVETVTARMMGSSSRPRFRKRDKVIFYGKKMLRKVKQLSSQATGGRSRMKKRQMVVRFAKRLLRLKKEAPLTLQVKEPSQAFLEEDILKEQTETRLPAEVLYMLKSIRVFGFFEKPLFLELCKHIEYCRVTAGQLLFKIGDLDDSIYVVQDGRMQVFVTEPDGTELIFKEVPPGESIASLLSIMDVIAGQSETYKTVSARAVEVSNILRLRVEAFRQLLHKYPESLVRVVQVIMVRLQRVTFTALHNYLGLTTQLIKSAPMRKLLPPCTSPKASPQKVASKSSVTENEDREQVQFEDGLDQTDDTSPSKQLHRRHSHSQFTSDGSHGSLKRVRKQSTVSMVEKAPLPTHEERFNAALEGAMAQFGIEDPLLLKDKLLLREFQAGITLAKEDSQEDAALFYVLHGSLLVSQKTVGKEEEENTLFIAHSGEIVGALSVITGEPSVFSVKTRTVCYLGVITRSQAYEILSQQPKAVLNLARTVVARLSPLVRQIDFALDWMHIESGRALYRQNESSDCTYIMLSGRVRSVLTRSDGKKELVGEYGKGDLVGIVEVLTMTPRATSVVAVRDSELAKLPEGLLNAIKIKYPTVVTRLIHLLGHRILGTLQKSGPLDAERAVSIGSRPLGSNFSTVAILPVTEDVPLSAFTMELFHALAAIGPTLRLTSDVIKMTLGPHALESSNEYRCVSWLGQQEDQNRIVLYQCDAHFSAWTQRCIRQADCILIVALADHEPSVGKVEMQLENLAVRIQKELILLHKEGGPKPRNTVQWLNIRSWCSSTHHICCPKRMFTRKSMTKMQEFYGKLFETPPSVHSDLSRLARFLTGTSIGLVLGGGGARGAAHVGMIRAIVEAGIPIDLVGGVSIGAFMGALWCQEKDLTTFTQKAREWSFKMTSYWRQLLDLTYPVTAMFTGSHFNRTIFETFGERQIEDLRLPYFTVTTNITDSSMRVHTHGSLWRYVRSSMSLSGYMPPLCDPVDGHLLLDGGYVNNLPGNLWRYVRASMTFTGPLPPLCDPEDGHLLVDGCYINNLPADIMRDMGAETIIAIDVGSQDDIDLTNYGDTLSGWWLLWKRWNPWTSPVKVPSLPEIQSRLAYVSCVRQLEEVKRSDYCTYVRPPIDKYKTLQFGSFDEIMEVGYTHGNSLFTAIKQGQRSLHSLLQIDKVKHHQPQVVSLQNASFTDLAEMVCKIKTPIRQIEDDFYVDDDDEFDEAGYSSEVEPYLLSDIEESSPTRLRMRSSMSDLSTD